MSAVGSINSVTGKRQRPPKKPYCLECKARRVKCDMTKPACVRCVRKGRPCHFDPFPIPSSGNMSQRPAVSPEYGRESRRKKEQAGESHSFMEPDSILASQADILSSPSMSEPRITIRNLSNNKAAEKRQRTHQTIDFLPGRLSSLISPQIPSPSRNSPFDDIRTGNSCGAWSHSDTTMDTSPGWNGIMHDARRRSLSMNGMEIKSSDSDAIYSRAFFDEFLVASIVVSQPERWRIALMAFSYGPLLTKAIQLLGAWQIDRAQAPIRYQQCLKMLAYSLQDWKADDPLAWRHSTGGIDSFVQHLKGVGALLLAQVKSMAHRQDDDPHLILLRLASQTFCCMDLLYAPMLNHHPSVNAEEFQILSRVGAIYSAEEAEVTKAFQCMHQVATLTANTTDASVIDTRAAEKMQKRLNACVSTTSWLNYKKASTPQSFIDLGVDIAYSPYKLNYSYPGITPEEVVFRTMMALIYHTLQLDLVLYRGCHSVSIQATQELCDTIVGMVQYLCSQTKFLWWCLWSLWMVVRFYFRLSEDADAKMMFALTLLESVVKILGVENLGVSYTDQLVITRDSRERVEPSQAADHATIHSLVAAVQESTYKKQSPL